MQTHWSKCRLIRRAMHVLSLAAKNRGIAVEKANQLAQQRMISAKEDDFTFKRQFSAFPESAVEDIEKLWKDPAILQIFQESNQLNFNPTSAK